MERRYGMLILAFIFFIFWIYLASILGEFLADKGMCYATGFVGSEIGGSLPQGICFFIWIITLLSPFLTVIFFIWGLIRIFS